MATSVKKRAASAEPTAEPAVRKPSVPKVASAKSAVKEGRASKVENKTVTKKEAIPTITVKKSATPKATEVKRATQQAKDLKSVAKDFVKAAEKLKAAVSKSVAKKTAVPKVATEKSTEKAANASVAEAAVAVKKIAASKVADTKPASQPVAVISRGKSVLNPSGAWPFPTGARPK